MRVLHHQRRRLDSHFSLERLFETVRAHLPPEIEAQPCCCPFPSRGLLPRVGNVLHAAAQKADVHHVVGDVHYLVFGLPSRRAVLTIHDTAALDRLRGLRRTVLRYFWFLGPMKKAARLTTISEASKDELRRHVGALADRAEVIPNCVPPGFEFCPASFREGDPVCLQVGTKWNKNLNRVAAALRGTSCRFDVVGVLSAEQRAELSAAGIAWRELGALDDAALMQAYRGCDFVCFASLYEGFGMPIIEAQATGRPVITSNCGPMPEVAGEGALYVDPRSIESIASAVRRLLADASLRDHLVGKALENIRRFRPDTVARQYGELYRSVVDPTRA